MGGKRCIWLSFLTKQGKFISGSLLTMLRAVAMYVVMYSFKHTLSPAPPATKECSQ